MSEINTGGPAFPLENPRHLENGELFRQFVGLTKREWFAGQAVQASLSGHFAHYGHDNYWAPANIASYAYEVADAMIAEREQGGSAQMAATAPAMVACLTEIANALRDNEESWVSETEIRDLLAKAGVAS